MKLLIDTNVLLDVFLCREQFVADAKKLFIMKQFKDAELWIAAQSYADLYYVGAKAHGSDRMQKILKEVFLLMVQTFRMRLMSSGKILRTVLFGERLKR